MKDSDDRKIDRRQDERKRLFELIQKRPLSDDSVPAGVLLSDVIEQYANGFELISPFDPENLKPASYKLTIGNEYAVGGVSYPISDTPRNNEVKIPPFEVAIIKTRERINMPRFLIGRWNIQVKRAYQGLVWVGGPQVDPGWVGHLACPIYNLSDKEVTLHYGDGIAVIDFVKTTPFREEKSRPYLKEGQLPKRVLFEDYEPGGLLSGLSTLVTKNLDVFREQVGSLQNRVDLFVSTTFAIIALLFAAMALFFGKPTTPNWWDPGLLWICVIAIFLATFSWFNTRSNAQWFARPWQRKAFEAFLFVLLLIAGLVFASRMQLKVRELDQEMQKLRKEVDRLNVVQPPPTPTVAPQVSTEGRAPASKTQKGAKAPKN